MKVQKYNSFLKICSRVCKLYDIIMKKIITYTLNIPRGRFIKTNGPKILYKKISKNNYHPKKYTAKTYTEYQYTGLEMAKII